MKNRLTIIPVFALLVCFAGATAVAQSTDDPEELLRQLAKERAQLEEQIKRLDELEKRLNAALAEEGATPEAAPTDEQETAIDASDDIVPEQLQEEPNQSKDSHQVLTAAELEDSDFLGSWPLFGTDYRMKVGGYFKLDALYDLDGTGDEYEFLIAQIPVDGSPEAESSGYFNMFVRETRVNLDVRETGQDGPAKQFFLEVDFFDTSSFSPRLRHAYVIYGNLLVGQTWTTIAELSSLPFTIDFGAGDALFGTRTPQVRWQQNVNSSWSWAVGLEMLQDSGIYNPYNLGGSASPQLPVLAARVTHKRPNSVRTLAALVQQLHWDGEGIGPDANAAGWALIFGGRQNLGSSANFFTWNLAYGDGTPDTIMALTGSDANANLTLDGRLVTRQGYSVALGLGHAWTDTLASNLALAWTDLENIGARAPDAIQSGGVGHLNLIWTPRNKLSTGIEFMWGKRENADGDDGSATRIQTMIKYFF